MRIKDNWKLMIHLLFRTYHFGVNNQWWEPYRSIFGLPFHRRWHIISQYKGIKFRCKIGFIDKYAYDNLFSEVKHGRGGG